MSCMQCQCPLHITRSPVRSPLLALLSALASRFSLYIYRVLLCAPPSSAAHVCFFTAVPPHLLPTQRTQRTLTTYQVPYVRRAPSIIMTRVGLCRTQQQNDLLSVTIPLALDVRNNDPYVLKPQASHLLAALGSFLMHSLDRVSGRACNCFGGSYDRRAHKCICLER